MRPLCQSAPPPRLLLTLQITCILIHTMELPRPTCWWCGASRMRDSAVGYIGLLVNAHCPQLYSLIGYPLLSRVPSVVVCDLAAVCIAFSSAVALAVLYDCAEFREPRRYMERMWGTSADCTFVAMFISVCVVRLAFRASQASERRSSAKLSVWSCVMAGWLGR